MIRQYLEQIIIDYGKLMGEKGFTPGRTGNLSARFGNDFLITTSGSSNGFLSNKDIVLIDKTGKSLDEDRKPSSEYKLHLEIYKKCPDVNFVVHVHPVALSSFATARQALDKPYMAENVFYFGQIPLAEYAVPSSDLLAENTVKYFDDYRVVLMANHGVVIGADSMQSAYLDLELAEAYAQVVINSKIISQPVELTEEEVEAINALKK